MNRYKQNNSVKINVPFIDDDGAAITVTSIVYYVIDENNDKIVSDTTITPASGATSQDITVSAANNLVTEGQPFGYRALYAVLYSSSRTYIKTIDYSLEGDFNLVPMSNSYQTIGEAQINAISMPYMDSWFTLDDFSKKNALVDAFYKIGKIALKDTDNTIVTNSNELTLAEFQSLSTPLQQAIKKAQVCEANFILGGNAQETMQKQNIASYTIGETSQTFKGGSYKNGNKLSTDAFDYLKGFVLTEIIIGRC